MEPSQFDEFTKAMATPTSRRKALKRMAMGTVASLLTLGGLGKVFAKTCPPGLTNCGGKCVNERNDPKHCGDCNVVCASGLCVNGLCCPPGAVKCGNSCCSFTCCGGNTCTNTQSDVHNCGACGNACATGYVCQKGACVCKSGVVCNGVCCRQGDTCVGGVCTAPACPENNCNGCAPFNTPPCVDDTCFCYLTPDEVCACGPSIPCAGAQPCTTCADCPAGSFCAIDTGCGAAGVCIPACGGGAKPKSFTGRGSAIIKHK